MPHGGTLVVEARRSATLGGGVDLSIRDSGVGMDAEQKQRVFDLFYTTKQRGSGLGLPLTQQIVVAHGGQIRCDSEPGQGTTFTLHFPATQTPAAEAAQAPVAES
jgi:signal transduction histidine kinase